MIESFINNKDYAGLLQACEEYELKYNTLSDPPFPLTELYPAYLGAYIIADDLHSARFLRKRMLAKAENQGWILNSETSHMWEVCAALWKTNYLEAYTLLKTNTYWSAALQPMIINILESVRERVAILLSKAYTTITMEDVVNYFGMEEQELIQALSTKGWVFDPETNIFTTWAQGTPSREPSNFGQLSAISDVVLHLEKF